MPSVLPASSLSIIKEYVDKENTAQSRRISTLQYETKNLMAVTKGDIYTETTETTSSGTLSLPTTYPLAPYATIDKITGKTVVVDGELQSSRIVSVKSTSANGQSSQNVTLPSIELKEWETYIPETGKKESQYGEETIPWFSGKFGETSNGVAFYYSSMVLKHTMSMGSNRFVRSVNSYENMGCMTFCGYSGVVNTISFILPSNITTLELANQWLIDNPTTVFYKKDTSTESTVAEPIDHFISVEAGGTISVDSSDAQAEATITYQTDLATT